MASKVSLQKFSHSVYYAAPAAAALNGAASSGPGGASKAPELILLSSWMDAQLKHTQKYLDAYRQLYPTSAILLIRSNQRDFYSLGNRLARSLAPAVDLLRAHASTGATDDARIAGPQSKILVHVFSNGGSLTLKELNELLRRPSSSTKSTAADGQPLLASAKTPFEGVPARAIVFDSCPGHSTLRLTLRAFTAPIKSPLVKYPAMAVFTLLYGVTALWDILLRRPPVLVRLSTYLNTPTLFPPIPRLYIYSRSDRLVPSTDIEAHAAAAEKNGVRVAREEFEGTSHVAHVRAGADRYWGAVRRLWEESGEAAEEAEAAK
ncbi:hypothetical protein JCM6882_001570 [Rhodosporidiobolus microsporus]